MWPLHNTGQTGGQVDADIDAPRAWDVTQGNGAIVVAVIDSGVDYTHPDLAANMWVNSGEIPGDGLDNDQNGYVDDVHGYDFGNDDGDPMDDLGHGTHVAGTIGAVGDNGLGVTGINWNVQIMALKFIGADGWGDESDAIEALHYAVANGATISNNSWGGDPYSQALFDAVASVRDQGHIFVAAAGNGNDLGIGQDNDATLFYPASYDLDNVIAVSAVDHDDNLAGFSNYGAATVDLAAPGVNILSTTLGGGYGLNSGTSMAAPHVTGVTALVQGLHSNWTYDQIIDQLLSTAEPTPELYGLNVTGSRLNAAAAVGNPEPTPPQPEPGSLPITEDFDDGVADFFRPQAGAWQVTGNRYRITPVADDHDLVAVSTLDIGSPLPSNLEIRATINAKEGYLEVFGYVFSNKLTNGYVFFDYDSPDDFKFAGADIRGDRWIIGHHDSSGWHVDASRSEALIASTNYDLRVLIENDVHATLFADESPMVSFEYVAPITDGALGVGVRNSTTYFDNVVVQEFVPDTFGPRLVSSGPFLSYSAPMSSVRLTFNEPIDAASFTVDDIAEFSGPAGPVTVIGVAEVTDSNGLEFEVSFSTQSEIGEYTFVTGPEIFDRSGNAMNQDDDGVNGESLEDRAEAAFHIVAFAERWDFGKSSTPVESGYTAVVETDVYDAALGYGWQDASMASWDRAAGGDLLRDFHYGSQGTFLVDVPNGQYEVVLTMGDEGGLHDQMGIFLEDVLVDTVTTQSGEYVSNHCLGDQYSEHVIYCE